jgi:release factor glutamine methyltransferase
VTALDTSPGALALARENAERTGLAIELVEGDALDTLPPGPFDLVVSNPPYVLEHEELPPELDHEPDLALFANGHTRAIAEHARAVLHGPLVLEVHAERAEEVAELLRSLGYESVRIAEDLAGRERVVEGRWER